MGEINLFRYQIVHPFLVGGNIDIRRCAVVDLPWPGSKRTQKRGRTFSLPLRHIKPSDIGHCIGCRLRPQRRSPFPPRRVPPRNQNSSTAWKPQRSIKAILLGKISVSWTISFPVTVFAIHYSVSEYSYLQSRSSYRIPLLKSQISYSFQKKAHVKNPKPLDHVE